ncbi:M20 aminoacylase family protein [uncultured Cardiobacterium sp.]|uniref:M20 aminoacylase family protein n=1 Tax=uncultured Cardiobacterium sp. TaxID=417619 RepID=UPI002639DD8E|nr:M20 aminoacylase family protein [uncultured Cardiobacterium sp.]
MNEKALHQQMIEWRHYLHQHPESAFEEENTARFVADKLEALGLTVYRNIGKTGVVGVLKCGDGKGVIGIRADMDCLQMVEQGDVPYKSQTENRMHACGHDGHTAMVLGAAHLLAARKNFNGTVCFVFQPAEEPGKGAQAMLDDGFIERFGIEEIYGLHNMPGMRTGTISTRVGGIMGSEDNFIIRIKGQGSHAARPHMSRDPMVIAAEIILALQTIVSRNIDPSIPIVISCTELHTDGIRNAIPTHIEIKGDTRSYAPETQRMIEERMRSICEHICAMNDAECEFVYTHEFAPTVNWEACVNSALQAANNTVGAENVDGNVQQMMISEDFGTFLQKIPGCFVFLGNGTEEEGIGYLPLHNAKYDFNDNILLTGAEYFAELIRIRLPQ